MPFLIILGLVIGLNVGSLAHKADPCKAKTHTAVKCHKDK